MRAALCAVAAIYLGYTIFGSHEAPGTALNALQWAFLVLALIGLGGSLYQMTKG